MKLVLILSLFLLSACASQQARESKLALTVKMGYDAELAGFAYPYPVKFYQVHTQNQDLKMAYMDVSPEKPADKTIVMFHGKNFSGFYFESLAKKFLELGYRVVMVDQIGFGKSSKPKGYQFTFQTLAVNTSALLQSIGVTKFALLGHSMGGMLATRYALMYPDQVSKLYLIDPIGLEDWKTMTSYKSIDDLYKVELASTADTIKNYQLENYYGGEWRARYNKLIGPALGWLDGPDYSLIAWDSALTTDMIFTGPVYYEFKNLKVPTVLVVGTTDKTAIGKQWATEDMKKKMGNYPKMGKDVASKISKCKLITLQGLGHVPFIQDPDKFWAAFSKAL